MNDKGAKGIEKTTQNGTHAFQDMCNDISIIVTFPSLHSKSKVHENP